MLASLDSFNLSRNQITGSIPEAMQLLKLSSIDFSNNQFSGSLPQELLKIAGDKAFYENPELCISGSICRSTHEHKFILRNSLVLVSITLSAIVIISTGLTLVSYKNCKRGKTHNCDLKQGSKDDSSMIEYFDQTESEAEEICNLKEENLIGSGRTGKVYRVYLKNKGIFAVKQLWEGNGVNMMEQIGRLAKIRHRNILKLYTSLSKGKLSTCLMGIFIKPFIEKSMTESQSWIGINGTR